MTAVTTLPGPGPYTAPPHSRDITAPVRLCLGESSFGMAPAALHAAQAELTRPHRYADADAGRLRAAIADRFALTPAHITAGNGADELLLFAALAFGPDLGSGIVSATTYFGHRSAIRSARVPLVEVPLAGARVSTATFLEQWGDQPRVAIVCNPHNPTGSMLSTADVDRIVEHAARTGSVVVFDEVYAEYAAPDGFVSAVRHVRAGLPVVVVRSFSKIYGMAGLRCGYAIANPELSARLSMTKHTLVFNVNRVALAAATASIDDTGFASTVAATNRALRHGFVERLCENPALEVHDSVTNFVLVGDRTGSLPIARTLAAEDIAVLACTAYGMPDHVRVSIGTAAELDRVATVLAGAASRVVVADAG